MFGELRRSKSFPGAKTRFDYENFLFPFRNFISSHLSKPVEAKIEIQHLFEYAEPT